MHLYLVRHGDALTQGYDDPARPLSSLGEEQAKLAALTLKVFGVALDAILSSPLLRAKQTASIVKEELKVVDVIITEYLVPSADHRQIINQLNELGKNSVLLVGHEPHLSSFISMLITGTRTAELEMKKGGIAFIETLSPIQIGKCVLRWLLGPEQMKHVK
ncbi:MAG: phosphohistidine phosphatase SixA [Ignavibacteriae bacterium]|nr:phosphohistidine phosphatase SixA [Ignavibacteriota bacterium]